MDGALGDLAPGGRGEGGDPLGFLVPMGAIFVIFYFLLIRPQQRKQKEHEEMLKAWSRAIGW